MIKLLHSFVTMEGTKPGAVLICLLLAGLFQGIGLTGLLPLLSLASESPSPDPNLATAVTLQALAFVSLPPTLPVLLILVGSATVLTSLMHLLAMRYVSYTVADVCTILRHRLIEHLMGARWSFFADKKSGRIANAISQEVTRASNAYQITAYVMSYAIQILIYSAVALLVSWRIAIAALILGLTIGACLHVFVKMVRKAGFKQTLRSNELTAQLVDALTNIKPMKAMAKQDRFVGFFDKKIDQLRKALRKQAFGRHALKQLQQVFLTIIGGIGFYMTVTFWGTDPSELLVLGFLLFQIVTTMGKAQQEAQKALHEESAFAAFKELLAEARDAREDNPGRKRASFQIGCVAREVDFSYGDHQILRGVTIEVPARGITVMIGPSGSGKTTISDLLLGLHKAQRGTIEIDGVALADLDLISWRSLIGYVPQDLVLFHDTILANITLGDPRLTETDAIEALKAARAWDFTTSLPDGLQTVVGEHGSKLSGGQRQRIALARALAGRPKLLILDEVTSALDPETEAEICQSIAALGDSMGVLAITHRPSWTAIAHRVYRIENGRADLVEDVQSLQQTA